MGHGISFLKCTRSDRRESTGESKESLSSKRHLKKAEEPPPQRVVHSAQSGTESNPMNAHQSTAVAASSVNTSGSENTDIMLLRLDPILVNFLTKKDLVEASPNDIDAILQSCPVNNDTAWSFINSWPASNEFTASCSDPMAEDTIKILIRAKEIGEKYNQLKQQYASHDLLFSDPEVQRLTNSMKQLWTIFENGITHLREDMLIWHMRIEQIREGGPTQSIRYVTDDEDRHYRISSTAEWPSYTPDGVPVKKRVTGHHDVIEKHYQRIKKLVKDEGEQIEYVASKLDEWQKGIEKIRNK